MLKRFGNGEWTAAYTLAADHYNKSEYASAAPMFERFAVNSAKPEERARGTYLAGNCYRFLGRDREAAPFLRPLVRPNGCFRGHPAKTKLLAAIALGVSENTAKAHVRVILRKLHAADRTEAVAAGFERGFLKID